MKTNEPHYSVALITDSQKILFIQRAESINDPWSGQIGFPGGKVLNNEKLIDAAKREVKEEIGLSLSKSICKNKVCELSLRQKGRIVSGRIHCFEFKENNLDLSNLNLNSKEVQDVFTLSIDVLADEKHIKDYKYNIDNKTLIVPSIVYENKTIWGLTYLMLLDFFKPMGIQLPSYLPFKD